jgi:hypothetical protein
VGWHTACEAQTSFASHNPVAGILAATPQSQSIVGTWVLTAADKLLPDGTRVPDYGPNPHGLGIFTADGYYSLAISS